MSKIVAYHAVLSALTDWEPYLHAESRLPGPRGNLELASAAAGLATRAQIEQLLTHDPLTCPENTSGVFLAMCGTIALCRLLAEGDDSVLPRLRAQANDPRWRVREGVAMALQRWGDANMPRLLALVSDWAQW